MKYTVILSMIALVVLAVPTLGDPAKIKVTDTPGRVGDGGPFTVTVIQGPLTYAGDTGTVSFDVGAQWRSFCLERSESLSFGIEYYVDVQKYANAGGVGGPLDDLDSKTAALYRQWRAGPLASDSLYQLAMWKLEEEAAFRGIWGSGGDWYDTQTGHTLVGAYQVDPTLVANLIASVGDPAPSDLGNVRVMTLWKSWTAANGFSGPVQDLLVVPVPAAVLLGMLGLTAAGLKLRRFV